MKNFVISSGHGKYVRGASGYLDEVDEARRVVAQVASDLQKLGATVETFNDDVSRTQNENLKRIVDFHNSKSRQLDVSVHFNAYNTTSKPMGTEVLYVTQSALSKQVASGIASAGQLINRGPKKRTDLYFLNNTAKPAILIEVCFVDSSADANLYKQYFTNICSSIAGILRAEGESVPTPPTPPTPTPSEPLLTLNGKASWFGGPNDTGVAPDEGLAFIYKVEDAPQLFLPYQPAGTTGLARRLDPSVYYFAARFDYSVTPKQMLLGTKGLVRVKGGLEFIASPADWGPNANTGRVADLSPSLMDALKIKTDDVVEVIFPAPGT
jgi:N-acetylmuramoyl-L-alanine amidase